MMHLKNNSFYGLMLLMFGCLSVFMACGGSQGETGPIGPVGPRGLSGDLGSEGPPGEIGERGMIGPTGAPGDIGPSGPFGLPGSEGPPGKDAVSPVARIELTESIITTNADLEIWGSGFNPGEQIIFRLLIDDVNQPIIFGSHGAQVIANNSGAFALSFENMGDIEPFDGIKTIIAEGSAGSIASVPVMIVDYIPEPSPPPVGPIGLTGPVGPTGLSGSTADLIVDFVEPGSDTTIWGAGFRPNEVVEIVAVGVLAGEDRIIVGGQANEFGAFQMLANIDLDIGIYTLMAIGDQESEATAVMLVAEK
jgi:hypothetical protein